MKCIPITFPHLRLYIGYPSFKASEDTIVEQSLSTHLSSFFATDATMQYKLSCLHREASANGMHSGTTTDCD